VLPAPTRGPPDDAVAESSLEPPQAANPTERLSAITTALSQSFGGFAALNTWITRFSFD